MTNVTLRRAGAWLEQRGWHYLDYETAADGAGVVYFEAIDARPTHDVLANEACMLAHDLERALPAIRAWHEEREDDVWIVFRIEPQETP